MPCVGSLHFNSFYFIYNHSLTLSLPNFILGYHHRDPPWHTQAIKVTNCSFLELFLKLTSLSQVCVTSLPNSQKTVTSLLHLYKMAGRLLISYEYKGRSVESLTPLSKVDQGKRMSVTATVRTYTLYPVYTWHLIGRYVLQQQSPPLRHRRHFTSCGNYYCMLHWSCI